MYSDLFSPSSLADLQAVLPQIPFAIWEIRIRSVPF